MENKEWISVDQELPITMQNVLLYNSTNKKIELGYYWGIDEDWQLPRFYIDSFVATGLITHWMLLPDKPVSQPEEQFPF